MTTTAFYSADDVATILGLHVRTVRNYVRDGRLPAVKIGKQYRISPEDVDTLTGGRSAAASFGSVRRGPQVEVTAIVQIEGIDEATMTRLSTLVTGAVSNRLSDAAPLRVETVHDPLHHSAKVIAIGSAGDTAALVGLIGTFMEAVL